MIFIPLDTLHLHIRCSGFFPHGDLLLNVYTKPILNTNILIDSLYILYYNLYMKFEWDEEKNKMNIQKHRISFSDALEIFFDTKRIVFYDDREDYFEEREITIGRVKNKIIITVVHTDRNGITRIISARKANKRERSLYHG